MKKIVLLSLCFLLVGCLGSGQNKEPLSITIQPDGNKMAYLNTEFNVKANQKVRLIMKNTASMDAMKHNIVVLNDESKINEVGLKALSAQGYLPEHDSIIAATPMANIGEETEITFTAPSKPGKYVYICTYPGHYSMMKGYMIVE